MLGLSVWLIVELRLVTGRVITNYRYSPDQIGQDP